MIPVQGHNVKNWKSSQELDSKLGGDGQAGTVTKCQVKDVGSKGALVEVSGLKGC